MNPTYTEKEAVKGNQWSVKVANEDNLLTCKDALVDVLQQSVLWHFPNDH